MILLRSHLEEKHEETGTELLDRIVGILGL